jgi:tetratricopeptide (TPR) repeat protein
MARRNQPPDRLPEQVRDHPEVVRACREWNAGRLFRVINNLTEEPSKFTVTHIGRVCGITTSRVAEYMKDAHQVTAATIVERIADGLRIPGERFGLATRPWETNISASTPAGSTLTLATLQPIEQSNKINLLAAMDRSRQMMDRTMANGSITSAQIDNIDQMVDLHAWNCVIMPPLKMLGRLIADFDEIQILSSRIQPPLIHTRLYVIAARIGALIADELMVLGDTHRARAWHNTATIAAAETESRELQSQVRALGILIPLYYGDAAAALKIAEEVCALDPVADRCSPALALAVTLKAFALAQIGSADASRAALDASGESFARLGQHGRIDSVFGFSERRWYFYRARTLAALHDFDHAWSTQERALGLYPDNVVGDPTIIKLDRALCLLRKNEIEEGCRLAGDTLMNLPPEHRVTIFLGYGEKLLGFIPEKYSTSRAVSSYRAVMAETSRAIEV